MSFFTVNADDFGWSRSCSKAIIEAFESGYIHTTTMLATGSAFEEARDLILGKDIEKCIGVHFDLTEGKPLTDAIRSERLICDGDGMFHGQIPRFHVWNALQKKMIYDELSAQAERIHQAKIVMHHADSHHHVHTSPTITPIVLSIMKQYDIHKLRLHRNIGNISILKLLYKNGYNQMLSQKKVAYSKYFGGYSDIEVIDQLPMNGVTEIMCHPDYDEQGNLVDRDAESSYEDPCGKLLSDCYQILCER